jgi:uncharacterized repeat protein (TIGR02543 family)
VYAINFNYGSASSGSPVFAFETSTVSSTVSRALYSYGDPALTLPTVGSMSKTGYSFAGWMLPNGNLISTSTFTPTATTTLTAKWTIQSFSISYSRGTIGSDTVAGSAPVSQSGNYLSTIILASTETSTVIAAQRYDFAGWTISGTRYPIGSSIQLGASNVVATATWVPVYTVTYILSGGVCISTTCNDNPKTDQSTLLLPVAPSRTGYNFDAWKDQSERSYLAGEELTVTATSYILTATWLGIERSVTYVNPNGVGIPTQGNRIYQNTFEVGVAPTRTGYDFGGWSDQGGAIYQSGDIYSVGLTNVTLTATWIPLGIVVTFFNNDGTSGSSTQSITAGSSTPLTQNALTRAGYNFGGWNTSSSGGGAAYSDLQNVNIVSALNLYAQWTAITNNAITYDGQGATTPASGGSTTYTTGTAIAAIPTSAPVRTGYGFGGWFTASTGGIRVTNGSYIPTTPFGAITLFARWNSLPITPTLGSIASVDGVLTVAFTQSDSVVNGITDYKYSIDGITYISVGNTRSPLSIPGLTPGTYTLRIIAVNAVGNSLPTAPVIVVVIAGPSVTVTTPGGGGGVVYVPSGPSVAEIAAAQKVALDKALADKAAADKLAADKAANEKAIADKIAADKAAADKAIADKLAADNSSAAAQYKSTCNLAQGTTAVTSKSSTMRIYSQVCFVPDLMKPLESDLAKVKKLIQEIKSKKIQSVTLSSFADEKNGVNFKSVAQARAEVVAAMIKKSNPKIKITYRLFGSSTKKNSLSLGRVVISA